MVIPCKVFECKVFRFVFSFQLFGFTAFVVKVLGFSVIWFGFPVQGLRFEVFGSQILGFTTLGFKIFVFRLSRSGILGFRVFESTVVDIAHSYLGLAKRGFLGRIRLKSSSSQARRVIQLKLRPDRTPGRF